MHSRSLLVAFLTLALSSFTAQAAPAPQQNRVGSACPPPQIRTVVSTVTVAARATATPPNNNNAGNNNNTTTSAATTKAATTKAATTKAASTKAATTKAASTAAASGVKTTAKGTATSTSSAAGATNTAKGNTGNPQTSLTLDPRVIAKGFANDGQNVPAPGQVKSLTSTNNFINFCLTVPNLPLTDGKQITTGSCDPAPIGVIPSVDNMPSSKFLFPKNFGTVKANTPFTIKMNIKGMQTGFFVNAQQNYFAAPQQLNAQGQIKGHSHVVVEVLTAIDQTAPNDPKKFAFFKGLNAPAAGGTLTADVTSGLPAGFYRLSSINTSSNHQPVIVPVAQHGSLDDAVYFTVTADGKPLPGSVGATPPAASSAAVSSVAASSIVKGGASASASASVSAPGKATATATGKATAPVATGKGAQPASTQAAATSVKAPAATGKA